MDSLKPLGLENTEAAMNLDSLTPCRFQCSTATLSLMRLKPHGLACLHCSHMGLETKIAPWTCNSMKPHGLATQTQISSSYCMFFSLLHFHWSLEVLPVVHVHTRSRSDSDPVPIRFRSSSDPVPIQFRSSSCPVHVRMPDIKGDDDHYL